MEKQGFPSLGFIAKYLFDCTGVLPRKGDRLGILESDKDKKSLQKLLSRLSKEETELNKNFAEIQGLLLTYIDHIFMSEKITLSIEFSLNDALAEYRELVKSEGTFLSFQDSILWLIKTRLIDRLVLSVQKNMYLFNVKDLNLSVPNDKFWYLPELQATRTQWPLAKALNWAYSTLNTSQTHFHFPGKNAEKDNFLLENNSQNASKWVNDKKLPSWSGLYNNLLDSFDAIEACTDPLHQREISPEIKKSIIGVCFIARCTTAICKDIEKYYGTKELNNILIVFKQQFVALENEHLPLKNEVEDAFNRLVIKEPAANSQYVMDRIWYELTPRYWQFKSAQFIQSGKSLANFFKFTGPVYAPSPCFTEEDIKQVKREHGDYIINKFLNSISAQSSFDSPHEFFTLFDEGRSLRQQSNILQEQVEAYSQKLEDSKFNDTLTWLLEWVKATKLYREENYEAAHKHYEKAFLLGKYLAGESQYKLINQYIESCAKKNDFKAFKKGVAWANYIGLKVRWIRGMEDESDNSLKTAFIILKQAHYGIL